MTLPFESSRPLPVARSSRHSPLVRDYGRPVVLGMQLDVVDELLEEGEMHRNDGDPRFASLVPRFVIERCPARLLRARTEGARFA